MASLEGNKIMVFRPTLDEFKNFSAYIRKMEEMGAHRAGVAKVIPPKEWIPRNSYEDVDITIPVPVLQVVTGTQGLYQLFNVQKKAMSFSEFKALANSERHKPPSGDPDESERKYWKNVTFNNPVYAADIPGTIYDKDVKEWNIGKLGTILDMIADEYGVHIEGVNTPYLYFGMWKATFAWHTEDMDLYSINYLHFGAPKTWYAIPPEHGQRLERLAAGFFPGSFQSCSQFLRHKMTIISPQVLRKFSIPYDKITQEAGQFMITFPYGYHCGFNNGFNCAESTNFASERWIDYGKRAQVCMCKKDAVKICMDVFVKKYQPEQWEEYQKTKQKVSSDSEEEEEDDQRKDGSEKKKESKDEAKLRKTKPKLMIELDDDLPLSKLKEALERKSSGPRKSSASKRQPVVTKSFTLPSSAGRRKKMEETKKEKGRKHLQPKSSTSNKILASVLDGLWKNQLPNFEMEQAFNIVFSQLEPRCSVCCFFYRSEGPSQTDLLAHLRENLHRPLSSLTADSSVVSGAAQTVSRIPEICFMSDDSSPASLSSWLDHTFTVDTTSPLLRCESCKLLVHASCYGVSDVPVDGQWKCQRCSQEDQKDVERSYCSLCRLGGGALKRSTDNRWVHIGCAVAMPEVFFENVNRREGINTSPITPARRKLKCFFCRLSSATSGKDNGACVQCCAGKCAVSFHVTCFVLAGFGLEPSDWPQPTETYCERHQRTRFKGKQRDFSVIHSGESVIAKHKNGRYYRGVVKDTSSEEYYVVSFNDGSYCDNLPPTDIVSHDSMRGDIPAGSVVQVKWGDSDQDLFTARVTGRRISVTYQIEFEDDSWLNVRRDDVYKASEDLPLKVQQRLSSATERANLSYWDDVPDHSAKRPRKQNPRFF